MKIKYCFFITFCFFLFLSFVSPIHVYAADTEYLLSNTTIVGNTTIGVVDRTKLDAGDVSEFNKGEDYVVASVTNPTVTSIALNVKAITSFGGSINSAHYIYNLSNVSQIKISRFDCKQGYSQVWLYAVNKDNTIGTKYTLVGLSPSQTLTFDYVTVSTGLGVTKYVEPAEVPDFDISDITAYPTGTVKIVQPQSGAKFDKGVSTAIDVEVWGKIPITINDSSWFGLGESTWLENALSGPITNNSSIYINGVQDRLGTGIGINSASLGDSYGLEILGDIDDWKQTGYYCFKYKFTYSPTITDSIDEITYGVSPITSWKVNLMIDDYGYTYYSDTLDISVDNYIDYNNDGIDDVTGEDLSNLNDNSSSIGLDENATIAETMEYYTNKFYDTITGLIKTPFTMLESALKLGDTYLVKLTNLLTPVSNNFKQLLSFVPDDIMTCIWGIIVCRLTWTTLRSFIAMLTKR